MSALFEPPRAAVREGLERAHQRGDLRDDVEIELILDLIGSLVTTERCSAMPTSDAEIERAVGALLQGIATDYPALLEHKPPVEGDPKLHPLHS